MIADLYVVIVVPPTVYNLKNVTGVESHEATLVCLSYGDPAPRMAFRKTSRSEPYHMGENVSICSVFVLYVFVHKCIMRTGCVNY